MKYRVFQFPLPAQEEPPELNSFLTDHRISVVTHHLVSRPTGSMLVFVVEYVDARPSQIGGGTAPKVDYRDKLSPEDFSLFDRLRKERKRIADEEGVPVYNVFTNAQLAEIVENRLKLPSELVKLQGVSQARVDKYAGKLLSIMEQVAEDGGGAPSSLSR